MGMGKAIVNLSQHFTLAEFIASEVAARRNIDNSSPPQQVIDNLKRIAQTMEDVRALLCKAIIVTSGYRCSALNKLVGSKPTSKHVQGLACDFKCPQYGDPMAIAQKIAESAIQFDQLLLEFYNPATGDGWVHIGLGSDVRRQVLTVNSRGTFSGLHV